jgi:hypothetical protein
MQASLEEVWYLKDIKFEEQSYRIITQNFNGPCSFIAICNILILRGHINIQPPSRITVSYEFLSQLVAEYLLSSSPDVDISAALSIMPQTQKGMDLNPLFTMSTSFRPAGAGGELKLFEQVGISLVHGWLVDPQSLEGKTLEKIHDYDSAVSLIAEVDHLTNGRFVVDEDVQAPPSPTSPCTNWTESEKIKIEDAIIVRRFLDTSKSQLTYHGLFHLATTLAPGSLVALFRSSHLSVLYKSKDDEPALYTLVTDQVFLKEPSVVWERLEDVDGGWSTFVDSEFVRASPAGGDFAGQSAEDALRASERLQNQYNGIVDPIDQALAQQMQAEEDHLARRDRDAYVREQQERRRREEGSLRPSQEKPRKEKKRSDCIIM